MCQQIKCPSCETLTPIDYITEYKGKKMCEGCAQNTADFAPADDPHGKGWTNNNAYGCNEWS